MGNQPSRGGTPLMDSVCVGIFQCDYLGSVPVKVDTGNEVRGGRVIRPPAVPFFSQGRGSGCGSPAPPHWLARAPASGGNLCWGLGGFRSYRRILPFLDRPALAPCRPARNTACRSLTARPRPALQVAEQAVRRIEGMRLPQRPVEVQLFTNALQVRYH